MIALRPAGASRKTADNGFFDLRGLAQRDVLPARASFDINPKAKDC
jgi:hypothetical protein